MKTGGPGRVALGGPWRAPVAAVTLEPDRCRSASRHCGRTAARGDWGRIRAGIVMTSPQRPARIETRFSQAPPQGTGSAPGLALASGGLVLLASMAFLNGNGILDDVVGVKRPLSAVYLLTCVALIGVALARDGTRGMTHPALLSCVLFYGYCLALGTTVALTGGVTTAEQLTSLGSSLTLIGAAALGVRTLFRAGRERSVVRHLWLVTMLSVLGVYLSLLSPALAELTRARAARGSGFFGNPNEAAAACAVACGLSYVAVLAGVRPALAVVAAALSTVACILTFSRGGILTLLALAAAGLLRLAQGASVRTRRGARWGLVALGFTLWFLLGGFESIEWEYRQQRQRMEAIEDILSFEQLDEDTVGNRFFLAQEGLSLWRDAPFLGHGPGALRPMPVVGLGPHNTYVLVLGEGGAVGLALFLTWLGIVAASAITEPHPLPASFVLICLLALSTRALASHTVLDDPVQNVLAGVAIGAVLARQGVRRPASRRRWPSAPPRPLVRTA